jgi:fumarate hydratase subunit alpha
MREVNAKQIREKVKELFLDANYCIGEDVLNSIKEASLKETSETGKNVLSMILENYKVAVEEKIAPSMKV